MSEGRPEDEEAAAAREAGAIGGPTPDEDVDPAERPLREAGEGEAEGFELAEEDLRRNAEHDDPAGNPLLDGKGFPEEDSGISPSYGEGDDAKEEDL